MSPTRWSGLCSLCSASSHSSTWEAEAASDYFTAVQEGKRRVNGAISVLQEVAGPCYPMLFLKMGVSEWTPVGEEMMHKVIPGKGGRAAVVVCDSEGNSKAMSAWFPEAKAREFAKTMERRGIPEFPDEVRLPI